MNNNNNNSKNNNNNNRSSKRKRTPHRAPSARAPFMTRSKPNPNPVMTAAPSLQASRTEIALMALATVLVVALFLVALLVVVKHRRRRTCKGVRRGAAAAWDSHHPCGGGRESSVVVEGDEKVQPVTVLGDGDADADEGEGRALLGLDSYHMVCPALRAVAGCCDQGVGARAGVGFGGGRPERGDGSGACSEGKGKPSSAWATLSKTGESAVLAVQLGLMRLGKGLSTASAGQRARAAHPAGDVEVGFEGDGDWIGGQKDGCDEWDRAVHTGSLGWSARYSDLRCLIRRRGSLRQAAGGECLV
ncbi:uncharacterized protein THITE_155615 [Thermothielavioides terrestris NRRL 8126]|uniref:Uncharacterized protein n=1 Tax=Thermothielavioides terrestris (strain ATCC 38088 / NRRL 8126) TaxID=578455 RepID=G2RAY6_THETT|nr:uncharacterized protein THITE_155615 [Thermothielavioides terrestris NRRL 8126]AEO68961.1 hypothetical protein THITE_155615 [Thermothielavioides terrestris NRRL 8126]